jgi:hypothetical protein
LKIAKRVIYIVRQDDVNNERSELFTLELKLRL